MQQLQPNTFLHGGTYKIMQVLGQGSFGITYLAEHTSLGRKVCIKEFFMKELNSRSDDGSITGLSDGSLSYNYAQKFRKEAQNLARMEHPNIVRVTDSFDENGTFYYVMEYIDGQNLNEYVKNQAISESEAISIIKDVANALIYMHEEKHMLHLDLKPGNIMRRASDGHIFLIDFGLSKHYSNDGQPETSTTIGLGTAGYAPIEQANQAKNGEFRPTIDVYALGATLFKLLTRETPPAASELVSDDELLADKLKDKYVPQYLIDFIVKAMLPNVRKRIQTIREFKNTLPASNATFSSSSASPVDSTEETIVMSSNDEKTELVNKPVAPVSHPNFSEASYIIDSKYVNMPTSTRAKAEAGDMDAAIAYGMMALRGQGTLQDLNIAIEWFNFARDKGDNRGIKLVAEWDELKKKYGKENAQVKTTLSEEENKNSNAFTRFFSKYAKVIMIIAGLFFIYDLICYTIDYWPNNENIHTSFGYWILHNFVLLSMIYTLGVKLLNSNKWYMFIATFGIALWIGRWIVDWNASYLWIVMGSPLTDGMAQFSQFIFEISHFGGLMLMIAFVIGVKLVKQTKGKIIFILLLIYTGTQFLFPQYIYLEDIMQVLYITEYAILLIASVLYFYSDKKRVISN